MMQFDISAYKIIFLKPDRIVEPISWIEHIPFAFALIQALKPRCIVELGVHSGNSYNAFCQAVQFCGLDTRCYGIDTWIGEEHAGYYDESIFTDLQAYQKRYHSFSSLLRMTFDEGLEHIPDGSVDLLHIDGLHTYEAVRHDYEAWLPKVSDRGVILFHDTQVHDKNFGVWRLWEEISGKYENFNFSHGYGLGVISIGDRQCDDVLNLLRSLRDNPFYGELFASQGRLIALQYLVDQYKTCRSDRFIQLFIDTGSGFSEEDSFKIRYGDSGQTRLTFDLVRFSNLKRLRLDPLNESIVIEIPEAIVIDNIGSQHSVAVTFSNASVVVDKIFYFDCPDPQIIFSFPSGNYIQASFSIIYHHIGYPAVAATLDYFRQRLADKDQIILDKDRLLADKDRLLADKDQQIANQMAQLLDLQYMIVQLHNSTSWRMTKPLRSIVSMFKDYRK